MARESEAMPRMRADMLLVARGLIESRAKARAAIDAGGVTANGVQVTKASDLLDGAAVLEMVPAHPWVSRAGVKLAHALEVFDVDPSGRICIDIGASTGGFTQVLLTRGAERVYAVDVGSGQLHASLRADPRVTNLERTDARDLSREQITSPPSLIVCDASFIAAAKVLTAPLKLATPQADLIVLIKPQFEAGPNAGKDGVLNEDVARQAAARTVEMLDGLEGFKQAALIDSPIRGGEGNIELLLLMRRRT